MDEYDRDRLPKSTFTFSGSTLVLLSSKTDPKGFSNRKGRESFSIFHDWEERVSRSVVTPYLRPSSSCLI